MNKCKNEIGTESDTGLVMVFTGNGKGKTTAALGQALRALGHEFKVYMIQFLKGREYGESLAANKFLPSLTIEQSGRPGFVIKDSLQHDDFILARKGFERAREIVMSSGYNMVILDEINVALDFGLIPLEDVLDLIENKPGRIDLILTGRHAPPEIIESADMVSEIKEIKHHYTRGIKERAGIEY